MFSEWPRPILHSTITTTLKCILDISNSLCIPHNIKLLPFLVKSTVQKTRWEDVGQRKCCDYSLVDELEANDADKRDSKLFLFLSDCPLDETVRTSSGDARDKRKDDRKDPKGLRDREGK